MTKDQFLLLLDDRSELLLLLGESGSLLLQFLAVVGEKGDVSA